MFLRKVCHQHNIPSVAHKFVRTAPSGRYARSLRYMLQRASERRVLPENSPLRQTREELQPDPRIVVNQQRSPTQMFQPQVPQHQGFPFAQHRMIVDPQPFPGGVPAQPQQWYDPTMDYADPEANAWATMELNTGAVAVNGMEAYMIPVGYVPSFIFVTYY